jgi:hypothetical protein
MGCALCYFVLFTLMAMRYALLRPKLSTDLRSAAALCAPVLLIDDTDLLCADRLLTGGGLIAGFANNGCVAVAVASC